MRKASPKALSVARLLLRAPPPCTDAASGAPADPLQQSCDALRPRITHLVGREGFRALLSRAHALAKREFPWLAAVQVDATGSFTGLPDLLSEQEATEGESGCAAVLAHLLGLLTAFIGTELTRQLVSGAWPEISLDDTDFGTEEGEG